MIHKSLIDILLFISTFYFYFILPLRISILVLSVSRSIRYSLFFIHLLSLSLSLSLNNKKSYGTPYSPNSHSFPGIAQSEYPYTIYLGTFR